jgi:hypothetical protein
MGVCFLLDFSASQVPATLRKSLLLMFELFVQLIGARSAPIS